MKIASYDKAEWIDVWRDRVPMTDDEVLITARMDKIGPDGKKVSAGLGAGTSYYDPETGHWCVHDVVAWMPFPEPYNPVEEE